MHFRNIAYVLLDSNSACRDKWTDKAYNCSNSENVFETVIMTIIAIYGLYVLFKVVIKKQFWDFIAISIPFLIVTYAVMTFALYL